MRRLIKNFIGNIRAVLSDIELEGSVYIGKGCSIKGKRNIRFGDDVKIRPYAQIWSSGPLRIGRGSEIGERCRISIVNSLDIGEKVLFSPNVYVTDCDHEYRDLSVPVMDQGIVQKGQRVSIGDGSYLGINSVIVGNVSIGKHCVIGANSVVTRDIPDYCVAVGSPARVIKRLKE